MNLDIHLLSEVGVIKKKLADQYFFFEGDVGQAMYMILKGCVGVYLNSIEGSQNKVAELGVGCFFGEMSLLEDLPRSATIMALEDTVVIELSRDNFSRIVSQQPQLAFRIMKGMSRRIRLQNESLRKPYKEEATCFSVVEKKPGAKVPLQNKVLPEENKLLVEQLQGFIKGKKDYELIAPPTYEHYIYEDTELCPVCHEFFSVKKTYATRLTLKGVDPDFRQRFLHYEPLWYMVWVCPHCYYASFNYEFNQLSRNLKGKLLEDSEHFKEMFSIKYSNPRKLNEVLESYNLLLYQMTYDKIDLKKFSRIWLRYSWLYSDANDREMYDYANEQAFIYYNDFYQKRSRFIPIDEQVRLSQILGELALRLGKDEEALEFFRKAIRRKGGNISINTHSSKRIKEIEAKKRL